MPQIREVNKVNTHIFQMTSAAEERLTGRLGCLHYTDLHLMVPARQKYFFSTAVEQMKLLEENNGY